jgi:hypothetical protein
MITPVRSSRERGVHFSMEPTNEDGYKSAKFLDLDGNEFWLFESSLSKKVKESGRAN